MGGAVMTGHTAGLTRVAFYEPGRGWQDPYHIVHPPTGPVRDGQPVLLGGELTVLRGGFPDAGKLRLSAPLDLRHMDWVRVWLPGDAEDDPTYLGEVTSEPWRTGAGEVGLRSLTARLRQCRWSGRAEGRFREFLERVLTQATLPPGITVGELPDLDATFRADTPFELLGDTLQTIAPALGGWLVGVDATGTIRAVNPGTEVMHRFPQGRADTPGGAGESYANCVRFSFEYPSGDQGWFEGINRQEVVDRRKGEVWEVVQVGAKELGQPQEPYRTLGATLTTTLLLGGGQYQNLTWTGTPFGEVSLADLDKPAVTHLAAVTVYPADEAARRSLDEYLGAQLTPPAGLRVLAAGGAEQRNAGLDPAYSAKLGDAARLEVVLHLTAHTALPPETALVFGLGAGWQGYADFGNVATHGGSWEPVPGQGGCFRFLLPPVSACPAGGAVRIAYAPAYRDACLKAGLPLSPITFRGGGRLQVPVTLGADPAFLPLVLDDAGDSTTIQPTALVRGKATPLNLPFPMFTARFTPADDPVLQGSSAALPGGTVLIDLAAPLSLPLGSSLELELLPGAAAGRVMVLPDLWDDTAARRYGAENKAGHAESVAALALREQPMTAVTLPPGEAADGWARYRVTSDVTVRRFILQGLRNVGRLRIRTPQLDTLTTYASELLRYRAQPAREWTGQLSGVGRVPAGGVAAFEVPGRADDELLDVQRVSYDLTNLKTSVAAGTPLPATDEDAIAGRIERIERTQCRAGG